MLAVLAALLSAAPPPPGPLMAVLEFQSKLKGAQKEEVDAGYLTDVVRSTALRQVPGLRVITRENMLVLLHSAGKKLEDCEGGCEVETGRLLGADVVITGEVLKFGSAFKLNLRLHETREGRLLSGAQASGRTVDELDQSLQAAVAELLVPVKQQAPDSRLQAPATLETTKRVPSGPVEKPKAEPPAMVTPPPRVVVEQPATVEEGPRRGGIGLYLGGALDASGKTVGGQVALVIGAGGPWTLLAGAGISPHPAARLSLAARVAGGEAWALAVEPRALFAPFPGGNIVGGGAGLRLSMRAAPWLEVIASAAGEVDHGPDGTFFAPLISLGLEPHL
jgi:TolB-like protein